MSNFFIDMRIFPTAIDTKTAPTDMDMTHWGKADT